MLPSLEELTAGLRHDLMTFVHACFTELNPEQEFSEATYLPMLASKLADTLTGKGPRRLIVCLPPRSLKSITVSVAAVAWLLGKDPSKRIICASYGQELADKHARDTKTVMQSNFYRRTFPNTLISKNAVSDFETTKQGFRMATSVNGVLTSRGADVLILDDILKPADALSNVKREAVNSWYDNTLLSRLNNKETGVIIIVMQRVHQDDLIGHLLGRGEDWSVIKLPAIATEDEQFEYKTLFGRSAFKRSKECVLDPSRESRETLMMLKEAMGSYNFDAQYQQNPAPEGGAIVKAEWLKNRYSLDAPLPRFTMKLQSWDTANKAGELNDFSVCTTWGVYGECYYLLYVYRQKLNYPELKKKAIELYGIHKPHTILIEDKGSGVQLIQELRSSGFHRVKEYSPPPSTDKVIRLHAQTAKFEAGKVLLPLEAPWLAEYERELLGFPSTRFDDQVDSTTQALENLEASRVSPAWAKGAR